MEKSELTREQIEDYRARNCTCRFTDGEQCWTCVICNMAIRALAAPQAAPAAGWVSVKERLPDESLPHEGYLLVIGNEAVDCMAFYKGQFVNWTNPGSPNLYPEDVTHWMPLPTAPEDGWEKP